VQSARAGNNQRRVNEKRKKTLNIIFGIVILICIITMIILYISMHRKISNTLTLDKLKVKDVEIDNNLNINPDALIKGNFNLNKFNELLKNNKKIQVFYIKNDDNKTKIPMEFHLNELLYLIYTFYKYQFIETKEDTNKSNENKGNSFDSKEINIQPEDTEEKLENSENLSEVQSEKNPDDKSDDNTKETFKNIPGYNIYYY